MKQMLPVGKRNELVALCLGIAFVSAAGLAFEITLTRLFAIAQGNHLSFLAVSLALLGSGASGTLLALRPDLARQDVLRRLARLSLAFSLCLIGSYLAINHLPFDSYRIVLEPNQLFYFLLYYLALVAPFGLGGLVLGLPLASFPAQTARVYAANLAGSGVGCIAALGALALFGGPGAVICSAILATFGALAFSWSDRGRYLRQASLCLVAGWGALLIWTPPMFDLQISPYKGLSQILRFPDARLVYSGWNAFSRIEVVKSSVVRSAPGLSLTYRGNMPIQYALLDDAESVSPIADEAPAGLLEALPVTLAYQLRPNARALILKPGGGLEVLAALNAGAREIIAVEDNPLITLMLRRYAPHVSADPRVQLSAEGARSYVSRSHAKFDVVHLALSDPFRPAAAGAYSLGENYLYTVEAFRDYLGHLDEGGILMVGRWLQLPPTEEARIGALAIAALEGSVPDPSRNILALRSFSTLLLLAKNTPFTATEIAAAKGFATARQFDWVAYPDMEAGEGNLYNVLREDEYFKTFRGLVAPDRRADFISTYPYDISPPTDDRPFFFHYFKWEQTPQVIQLIGKLWQPFGGTGYLILFALLLLTIGAASGLILWPLVKTSHKRRLGGRSWLAYFTFLGIGFLFVEIPLIQRFILFLDHPVYAFATVLCALLLTSGVGSFLSARMPHRVMLASLIAAILSYPLILSLTFQVLLGAALVVRILVSLALLAPIGFLMGIPFPKGLAHLNRQAPDLVPLAWGINGCASVVSSILAMIGATTWGFSAVMLAGAGVYALALATLISPVSVERKQLP